jgi:hypothetical protein
MKDNKKGSSTSVRFSVETKTLLDQRHKQLHISKSDLICFAVERCLVDNRWTASPTGTGASSREQDLYEGFVDLCQVINKLAFAVEEALDGKSRIRRLEAKNLVHDAFVELESARKKLNVR